MAIPGIGKVIFAAITADGSDTYDRLGVRVYPPGGIPEEIERDESGLVRPYAAYEVRSNQDDEDLDGAAEEAVAEIALTVVAATYAEIVAALTELVELFDEDDFGGTIAGVVVTAAKVSDVSDQPNGPIDSDFGQVYTGDLSVSIAYEV